MAVLGEFGWTVVEFRLRKLIQNEASAVRVSFCIMCIIMGLICSLANKPGRMRIIICMSLVAITPQS